VTSVLSAAIGHDGGGGLGILLPVILVGVLGVVARIVRRRRTS
jgi:hypothetical protein